MQNSTLGAFLVRPNPDGASPTPEIVPGHEERGLKWHDTESSVTVVLPVPAGALSELSVWVFNLGQHARARTFMRIPAMATHTTHLFYY